MVSQSFLKALTRKKLVNTEGTQLSRVLNLADVSFIGLGVILGLGTFVLPGSVAKNQAGPAVCVSFLIAAIASVVAGVCYAEFASRVPKSGSAYAYSYFTIGEFVAFVIGWDLILEYVIGTAGLARGLSDYVNTMVNNSISNTLRELYPIDVGYLSRYPDFLAFGFLMLLTGVLCLGVRESTMINNIVTSLEMITVITVIVAGYMAADFDNWTIPTESVPEGAGKGGFLPFGFSGVMEGAAKCFFAFVGFDAVATAADEVINPRKNVPLGIGICLLVTFITYFGVSTVITLMAPYYNLMYFVRDVSQSDKAPFPYVFDDLGWVEIKWVATIGAIFAMSSTLVCNMFALPRIFYAMASDGVIFKVLAIVNQRTKTPIVATIVSGLFAGTMAIIFDVNQLVEMLSIGTLMAYTIVSICVLVLRYSEGADDDIPSIKFKKSENLFTCTFSLFKKAFNLNGTKEFSRSTSCVVNLSLFIFICACAVLHGIIVYIPEKLLSADPYIVFCTAFMAFIIVFSLISIGCQPMSDKKPPFKVPLVPVTPCLSIFINIHLMMNLSKGTWIRLIVWQAVGLLIYFCYGIRHSKEGKKEESTSVTSKSCDVSDKTTTRF